MKLPVQRAALATTATFVLAAVVGAAGGALAVGFQTLVDLVQEFAVGSTHFTDAIRAMPAWYGVLLPAVGGLIGALIIRAFDKRAQPFGIPGILEAVSVRRRRIRGRPIATRAAAAVAVIATGGSVGREGPIVQLAVALASKIARVGRFDARRHALMLGCGVAAGMAAAYNAPLAGAFFVMEVILASFAIDVFAPLVVSSVFAALAMRAIRGGDAAVYAMPSEIVLGGFWSALAALPLGALAGVVAVGFQRLLSSCNRSFGGLRAPLELKLALAGLAVGAIALALPEVYGNGYLATSEILGGRLSIGVIVALIALKPLATALSIGAGAPGGVFTPALLTGASFGALFAAGLTAVFPSLAHVSSAYAVLGMAALIAGLTHAPIMSMVLLVELTHDFGLVLPLVLATVAASLVAKLLARDSIFTESLRARGVPMDLGIEELTLRRIRVRDLVRSGVEALPERATLDQVLARFHATRLDVIYVVGERGKLVGQIDLHDVKAYMNRESLGAVVIAADLASESRTVTPDMSLAQVLASLDDPELEELPVVEERDGVNALIGRLTRRDVIAAIQLEVLDTQTKRTTLFAARGRRPEVIELPDGLEIAELPLPREFADKRLADTDLARLEGITVLSLVERNAVGELEKKLAEPDAELARVAALVVMGRRERVEALRRRLVGSG